HGLRNEARIDVESARLREGGLGARVWEQLVLDTGSVELSHEGRGNGVRRHGSSWARLREGLRIRRGRASADSRISGGRYFSESRHARLPDAAPPRVADSGRVDAEEAVMKVHEAMTKDVVVVSEATPLKEVARLLAERRISGVPVVDDARVVVGVVSETDIVMKVFAPTELHGMLGWMFGGYD